MSFYDNIQTTLNNEKSFTENGATAYATSGKKLLDFNFELGGMRQTREDKIVSMYSQVYYEDPLTAIKYLFYVGDVREGVGERRTFNICMNWLVENQPEVAKAVLKLIPFYTRWDNLVRLVDSNVSDQVVGILNNQLNEDIENLNTNKPISLLGKWMKSENATSPETKRIAKLTREKLRMSPRAYRKTLAMLRKHLDVVERKMCASEWTKINYETVPSKANLKYNSAFLRNDEDRRREYLANLAKGEAKINAGVLQPHEIVHAYGGWGSQLKQVDTTLEELWKALPVMTLDNVLVVRDGSGSMRSTISGNTSCLDVATALAIYMADHNSNEWKNKFITFSRSPKLVDLSNCRTLRDKLGLAYQKTEVANTDIQATMELILQTAIENHVTQEEMPKLIVICSDMQFDTGTYRNFNKTLFEEIIDGYEKYGYQMPKICYWNIASTINKTVPIQKNKLGIILCSGFSLQIMKMFMSNEIDPYKILLEQINSERYQAVEDAVKNIV